jgi:leader peptidase (prepilin peptidase) / N-methyltransferase
MIITVAWLVLGLLLGSFINAAVWRFYLANHASKKTKIPKGDLSITKGRSMCVHCGHQLAWYDLLPILSWLSLRGKCRYCGKLISPQYPLVELATELLFALSYLSFSPVSSLWQWAEFVVWLTVCVGFTFLFVYDLKYMLLPDKIVFPLTGLYFAYFAINALLNGGPILQPLLGSVLLFGFFWVLFQVSAGKWIGGGDVKLALLLGLLGGSIVGSLLMLFLASLLGTLVAVPLMATKKAKAASKIPFGPFLIIATIIVYLQGSALTDAYLRLIGLQ